MKEYSLGELIYSNPLSSEEDVEGFKMEGEACISFPKERLRMENKLPATLEQKANFVFWCPEEFEGDFALQWRFWPIREPGLAIMFFNAKGRNGEDLFDEKLKKRVGPYGQYHHGDIDAYHISYFRRRYAEERSFHLCNLRKSYGFHMVAQGADPLPPVYDSKEEGYEMMVIVHKGDVIFYIEGIEVLRYRDDGMTYGARLEGGKIGFRQMAPLIAEYADLKVYRVGKIEE